MIYSVMDKKNVVIRTDNVKYAYEDGHDAVRGVSFEVYKGEFLAILGHNGSGKSTLAKLINALFLPSEGEISVNGIVAKNEDEAFEVRRHCGMVFQNPDNQIVATVVEEDVAFGLENMGVSSEEIRIRVDAALKNVGMEKFAMSAPHMLSGGQKQRVAIAGVIAMRPDIIVFDEATAMLDPSGRAEVMRVVQDLNQNSGVTVIWITHFMEEAALADRVLVMDAGLIAMEGTPMQVFSQVDTIRNLGLEAPEMIILANKLRAHGIDVKDVMTVDEMAVELCRLKS